MSCGSGDQTLAWGDRFIWEFAFQTSFSLTFCSVADSQIFYK